jgi:tRNA modification GTPase
VVLQLLLARCLAAGAALGARLAQPGEFTQRAFLNGKLDLAQAEAVSDLIDASTEAAARSAGRSLSGQFSATIQTLATQLIELRSLVEATLDFPDEGEDFLQRVDARGALARISAELKQVLAQARQGALLREGVKVVLAGQPNVGKSSLLNALAGAELAIVTPIPGTTRDKVSETVQIDGIPIHVTDTAGLRTAEDEIERLGIARSWQAVSDADLVVFVHDLTRTNDAEYVRAESDLQTRLTDAITRSATLLHVHNKVDAVPAAPDVAGVRLSTVTGAGLETLRQAILGAIGGPLPPEGVHTARARHIHALQRAQGHLSAADSFAATMESLDLLAEELRQSHNALSEITGAYTPDDLLGHIFSKFCIGK